MLEPRNYNIHLSNRFHLVKNTLLSLFASLLLSLNCFLGQEYIFPFSISYFSVFSFFSNCSRLLFCLFSLIDSIIFTSVFCVCGCTRACTSTSTFCASGCTAAAAAAATTAGRGAVVATWCPSTRTFT